MAATPEKAGNLGHRDRAFVHRPVWWFFVFWLPQYLSDARGFSLKQIAAFAWIPFVAADIGNFVGGFASGALIKRGMPVIRARKSSASSAAFRCWAAYPQLLFPARSGLFSDLLCALGYASWSTMGLTFPSDLFPPQVVGSVTGLSGLGAGLASTALRCLVGTLVDQFSYVPAFVAAGTAPVLATVAVLMLIRRPQGQDIDTPLPSGEI